LIEPDREKAIGLAMDEARAGTYVARGKRSRELSVLADRTFEFDDREMARCALRDRGFEAAAQRLGFALARLFYKCGEGAWFPDPLGRASC